jgi:hypothetical protein
MVLAIHLNAYIFFEMSLVPYESHLELHPTKSSSHDNEIQSAGHLNAIGFMEWLPRSHTKLVMDILIGIKINLNDNSHAVLCKLESTSAQAK